MASDGPGCEMAKTELPCGANTPASYLMCGRHWRQVSHGTQRAVYAGLDHGLNSPEYLQAVEDAKAEVLERSRR